MRKTYKYNNIQVSLNDDIDVIFEVKLISNGNTGYTNIDTPNAVKQIRNTGHILLGNSSDLKGELCFSFSDFANALPQVNTIDIEFLINGEVIVPHSNPKSEESQPYIDIVFQIV